MMENYSVRKLAVIISAVVAVVMAVVMLLAAWVSDADGTLPGRTLGIVALSSIAIFVISYAVLGKVFDKVGLGRERIVYGPTPTVSLDVNKNEGLSQIISQVNDDVKQWAEDRENEIAVLRKNEKFRREYLGNVAHELKTPLNTA